MTISLTKSQIILNALLHNQEYAREVLPYIKPEYFENSIEKTSFEEIHSYSDKYGSIPSPEELQIEVLKRKDLNEDQETEFKDLYSNHLLKKYKVKDDWIRDKTEKFCKDRALFLAINESILIYDDKTRVRDEIPDLIRDALSVSFDHDLGLDYFEDVEKSWDFYHSTESLIPFKLDILNRATEGGLPTKTLNIFMGGTNTFKSGFLCDLASHYVSIGLNVLYVTLEMSEWKIRERIDANLMKLRIPEVHSLLKPHFVQKVNDLKTSSFGRLKIKEYPMTSANANHFRILLKELELKEQFKPTVIMIDYISICASVRVKDPSNLYSYNKAIAEELRGLAQETNTLMWSAIQTNRGGLDASDVSLDNTAESIGVPASVDIMWGIINTEELEEKGLIIIKQLKSRAGDKNAYRRMVFGIDRPRMTIYEIDQEQTGMNLNPEKDIIDDSPAFDKTSFGNQQKTEKGFKFN